MIENQNMSEIDDGGVKQDAAAPAGQQIDQEAERGEKKNWLAERFSSFDEENNKYPESDRIGSPIRGRDAAGNETLIGYLLGASGAETDSKASSLLVLDNGAGLALMHTDTEAGERFEARMRSHGPLMVEHEEGEDPRRKLLEQARSADSPLGVSVVVDGETTVNGADEVSGMIARSLAESADAIRRRQESAPARQHVSDTAEVAFRQALELRPRTRPGQ